MCKRPPVGSDTREVNGMELCQGKVRMGVRKGSLPEGGGHGPTLPEVRESLDCALKHRAQIFEWSCMEPGVRRGDPCGSNLGHSVVLG